MSPEFRPSTPSDERLHARARWLAADSIDVELEPADAIWLSEHLAECSDCASVGDEYRSIHDELRSLQTPEPPRDLWARTSAAMDAMDARSFGRRRNLPTFNRIGNRPLFGTAIAVGFVVLVAGASLLAQSPIPNLAPGATQGAGVALATGSAAGASQVPNAPLAIVKGTSYWIASDGGVYQIKGSSADCSQASGGCIAAGDSGQTLGSIASDTSISAVLAPDASQAAVWTSGKIAIVPLAAAPQTVSLDLLTPRPTLAATATPAPATPQASTPASTPAGTPASTSVGTTLVSPLATLSIAPSLVETLSPTPAPTASATGGQVVTQPIAILDGYEIVGRDPEFSADGSLVAFSARPVDHSTGPDLFVWRSGDERAHPVTTSHADLFAGWLGHQDGRSQKILVSEIAALSGSGTTNGGADTVVATSYVFDPENGDVQRIDRPMLVAGVDPTGRYLVYWSGSVEFDTVSGLWQPGTGDLYFESWSDLQLEPATLSPKPAATPAPSAVVSPSPSPALSQSPSASASPTALASDGPSIQPDSVSSPQPSASAVNAAKSPEPPNSTMPQALTVASGPASVRRWVVRWDATGQNVAVWVADSGSVKIGRLNVFSIDPVSRLLSPTLAADEVLPTIGFDASNLVYTSAMDGRTYMKPLPVIPPSSVSTAVPTVAGQAHASIGSSVAPAPATDAPGS
jgi:hypothetical protein